MGCRNSAAARICGDYSALISASFIASDACYDQQMQRALQRHHNGTARVIPVILKPCDWQNGPFSPLQALPKEAKPIAQWDDKIRLSSTSSKAFAKP